LHDLVEQAPQMLPLAGSPRLTVLGREVRLGSGYADLVAVESTGRLVVIEVKLAGNSEARRAVVAQVLSYAGYLQGLDADQLESQILAAHLGSGGTVLAAAQADDQEHSLAPEAFSDGLARSLAEGSFRLVLVLDSAPDELMQVVGYLLVRHRQDRHRPGDGRRLRRRRLPGAGAAASGACPPGSGLVRCPGRCPAGRRAAPRIGRVP
jgi:hypothetical protein